ncbi:oxidoreductase, aldo/keto reductase family protein [Opisthorchis viverrini]|nr:oxidoreductase, aldo/keto reductase family protein [Opisthorchis viverrini]
MSLEALQLSYIDMYMIHWPGLQGVLPPGRIKDSRGYMSDLRRLSWQALETVVILERPKTKVKSDAPTKSDVETSETVIQGSGPYRLVRSLGVCNYLPRHIEELASYATITPCVVQYEFHPFLSVKAQEHPMRRICTRLFPMQSVHFQCHTSLANGSRELLTSPIITEAASELQRTPAQVVLRWALEKGHSVIAKSSKPRHIVENSRIFGWDLDSNTVQKIDAMERNERYCWDPHAIL